MSLNSRTKVAKVPPMVQLNLAAGGQVREALLDLTDDTRASCLGQRPVALVEPELLVRVADEIEHCQARLAVGLTKAATELLQKHRRALGGAEEEHVVDLRHVHAEPLPALRVCSETTPPPTAGRSG